MLYIQNWRTVPLNSVRRMQEMTHTSLCGYNKYLKCSTLANMVTEKKILAICRKCNFSRAVLTAKKIRLEVFYPYSNTHLFANTLLQLLNFDV